jgi:hypothetical protein
MQPSAAVGIDAGQHLALTATVTGDAMGMGVAWTVACPAGVANCGAMQSAASASGAADVFQPAAVNAAEAVQITATSVADRTKSSTVIVTVNPPPSASNQAQLQSTTYGTAYSLTLASFVQGGTPPLTCTISGGGLPAGLSLTTSGATISGTPTQVGVPIAATYACTDSASPPVALPVPLAVSIEVLEPVGAGGQPTMNQARYSHTATLLPGGEVLIVGGTDPVYMSGIGLDSAGASAEVYDPSKMSFVKTGSLITARYAHTATLLSSGQALLTGGWYVSTAELYDPASGTFSATGNLTTVRSEHTATRLSDGRVLLVGGNDANGVALASAEIYDPATRTFSATGGMTTARAQHVAALLQNGSVLVAGGANSAGALASAEIFDPATGVFSAAGSMLAARIGPTATTLGNGKVLIAGGDLASAELYDPGSGSFAMTGSMSVPRSLHTATLRADGTVLVAGGATTTYRNPICIPNVPIGHVCWPASVHVPTAATEVYDPATGTFTPHDSLAQARESHTATLLANGYVLIAGGQVLQQAHYGGNPRCSGFPAFSTCVYLYSVPATNTAQTLQ